MTVRLFSLHLLARAAEFSNSPYEVPIRLD